MTAKLWQPHAWWECKLKDISYNPKICAGCCNFLVAATSITVLLSAFDRIYIQMAMSIKLKVISVFYWSM